MAMEECEKRCFADEGGRRAHWCQLACAIGLACILEWHFPCMDAQIVGVLPVVRPGDELMVGLDDHRPSGRSPSADGTSSGLKNWQQLEVGNRPRGMWRRPCSNWCEGYIHVASHARMVEEEDLVVSRQRCDNIPGRPIFESHPRVLQQDRAQCAVGCHGCFESFRKGHIVLGAF